jgi:hypothetical protein
MIQSLLKTRAAFKDPEGTIERTFNILRGAEELISGACDTDDG